MKHEKSRNTFYNRDVMAHQSRMPLQINPMVDPFSTPQLLGNPLEKVKALKIPNRSHVPDDTLEIP